MALASRVVQPRVTCDQHEVPAFFFSDVGVCIRQFQYAYVADDCFSIDRNSSFARSRVSVWVVYDFNDAAFSKALDDQVASPQNKKAKTYREGTKTAGQKYTSQTNNNASRVSEEKERYKEEVNNIYESFRDRYQFR